MEEIKTEESIASSNTNPIFPKGLSGVLPDLRGHLVFWPLMLGGLVLDLWTKKAAFEQIRPGESIVVIDGFLKLVTALNNGAAFGMFAGKSYILMGISLIALLIILAIFLFGQTHQKLAQAALGFFAAGVCGNLYDRVFNDGLVRDFIDAYITISGREYHWHTFNFADSFLCIGVGLLIISTFLTGRSSRKHAQQHK
ncbi:MAG: signal peptidase II [Phycisphaerales bacterium]|jgi:signal peptidase II